MQARNYGKVIENNFFIKAGFKHKWLILNEIQLILNIGQFYLIVIVFQSSCLSDQDA